MLLVEPGQVMNSTSNEGSNLRPQFGDENLSNVASPSQQGVEGYDDSLESVPVEEAVPATGLVPTV